MKPINEITAAEFQAQAKGKPRFNRSPPEERTVDGHVFASKAEAMRYAELRLAQEADDVAWIAVQPVFLLAGVEYRPDFLYYHKVFHRVIVEEIKGKFGGKFRAEALRAWRRNAAQMKVLHGIDVVLVEK